MTVHLNWPLDVVVQLKEKARQNGLSLDAYLLETILEKVSNGDPASDEAQKHLARQEAGQSIRELRKGNVLGPSLTIRDLIEEGRGF